MDKAKKVKIDLKEVKAGPKEWASNIDLKVLEALIKEASRIYYNSDNVLFNDFVFDTLYDTLKLRDPKNSLLKKIGSEIEEIDSVCDIEKSLDNDQQIYDKVSHVKKVKLPIHMGSMDKIKTREGIKTWLKSYHSLNDKYDKDYVISEKLDGASGLLMYKDGRVYLYTRGNGNVGRDISHICEHMIIPKYSQQLEDIMIRGELIVTKENYNKSSERYSTPRAMVNGIIGSKIIQRKFIRRLDFVGFELVKPVLRPSQQFEIIKRLGFSTPKFIKANLQEINVWEDVEDLDNEDAKNGVHNSFLLKTLQELKDKSEYDIDGIIVSHNTVHERNTQGNPDYAFAFKSNNVGVITEIVNIEWNTSKYGLLIPTIEVKPVNLGSLVKHASGHNAKYIFDNNLGPGSVVRILLSGEVIPYISEIINSTEAQMPDCEYVWNKNKVNIMISNNEDPQLLQKQILNFFRTLYVENLSVGIIKKLINSGYDSIYKILKMDVNDFLKIEGFKATLANKIYNNVHDVINEPIELSQLMLASLQFGHGYGLKRFQAILKCYPNILEIENLRYDTIEEISGFSNITAKQFVDNLELFKNFLKTHDMLSYKITKKTVNSDGVFLDKKFVLTGFRDETITNFIEKNGGKICPQIKKDTFMLICKKIDLNSTKITAAQLLGIDIITKDIFVTTYMN